MKPFNEILTFLCDKENTIFIDNHDSFAMASGEPFCFYKADTVNLKLPGIRTLVHIMHDCCPLLPKKQSRQNFGSYWTQSI